MGEQTLPSPSKCRQCRSRGRFFCLAARHGHSLFDRHGTNKKVVFNEPSRRGRLKDLSEQRVSGEIMSASSRNLILGMCTPGPGAKPFTRR